MRGINRRALPGTSGEGRDGSFTIQGTGDASSAPSLTIDRRRRPMTRQDSAHDPNKLGWGFAAMIIVLAIAANVTAYSIHKATYLKPDKPAAAQAAAH